MIVFKKLVLNIVKNYMNYIMNFQLACKAEQLLRGMELQQKEVQKD